MKFNLVLNKSRQNNNLPATAPAEKPLNADAFVMQILSTELKDTYAPFCIMSFSTYVRLKHSRHVV